MKRDKRLERALHGPSIIEVVLAAILSSALGVVLATGYLVLKPVEAVKELPKEADRPLGQIYYVEGVRDTARAKLWRSKIQSLRDGVSGEVVFTEEDLNEAVAPEIVAAPPKKPAPKVPAPAGAKVEEPAPAPMPEEVLVFAAPNFRIRDGSLQAGVVTTINLLSLSTTVTTQTQGTFEKVGDAFAYKPATMMIGSLPVHRIPGAMDWLLAKVIASQGLPDEGQAVLKKATAIAVDGRFLKVTLP